MEKAALILGSNNYGYYYGVHRELEQLGFGIVKDKPVVTLTDRGVSNHVYFYFRSLNQMKSFKSYANTRFKIKDLFDEIDSVIIMGQLDDKNMETIADDAEKRGIQIIKINL